MRRPRFFFWLATLAVLLACNFPPLVAARSTPEPPSATPTEIVLFPTVVTFTPPPAASPTSTVVPTPSTPQITPNAVNVNCRSGPDVAYDAVSVLQFGDSAQVAGRNADSSWWYVHDPSNAGSFCWIAASVVSITGPQGGIQVVAPPPAIVTKVTVDVALPSTTTCGAPNAVTFSGTITTNGSASVKYQWEITGDKVNTTAPETLNFANAGTKDVPDPGAYSVDCGNYRITLHVVGPNDIAANKNFKVAAP
jgi:hypothetical protein